MTEPPAWLNAIAYIWLLISFASATVILFDLIFRQRQKMAVMNAVWPVTALYWGPMAVWGYYETKPKLGKQAANQGEHGTPG